MDQTLGIERWRTQSPYPHWAGVLLEKIECKQMVVWPGVATCFVRGICKVQRWPEDRSSSVSCPVMSDSLWPHGLQPAKLLCPWNFPGKNTGKGCHSQRQETTTEEWINIKGLKCVASLSLSQPDLSFLWSKAQSWIWNVLRSCPT